MSWLPSPFPDETFYSLLVRLHRYLGCPNYAAFSRMLTGGRHYVALCHLPCGVLNLGERAGLDRQAVDRLIRQTTTINYHSAFASSQARQRALDQIRHAGSSLQFMLGLALFPIGLPERLRFCADCLAEMKREVGEVWWCRAHQLPGVDVCHKHGIRLGTSSSCSDANRLKLIEPTIDPEEIRYERRQPPFEGCLEFAKLSASLLDQPPPARSPLAWYEYYRERLTDRGLLRGNCQISAKKIATQIRRFWSGFAGVPHCVELTDEPAITRFFGNRRRLAPPAQHILIDRALHAAPLEEGPFGPPPYACENPLADHFGQRVVSQLTLVRDRGKIHGHFACGCGYSYSRTRQVDGEIGAPRIREYGPLADTFLKSETASLMSLRAKGRHMRIDPMTVKAIAQRERATGISKGVSGMTLPKS